MARHRFTARNHNPLARNLKKALIITGISTLLIVFATAYLKVKNFINSLVINISGFQLPTTENGITTFPLSIVFDNPTSLTMPVDKLEITLYAKDTNGQFVKVGEGNHPRAFNITPGTSRIDIQPTVLLKAVNPVYGETFADKVSNAINAVKNGLAYRVQITATIKGVKAVQLKEFAL